MFKIKDLTVSYGKAVALEAVSLEAKKGEFIAVIGANGAGKTTLLNTAIGFLPANDGVITYQDEDILHLPTEQRVKRGISLVSENRDLFSELSVEDNLRLGGFLYQRDMLVELEWVYNLLPKLHERRHQKVRTLSGGEQQMVAIGRALMSKPKLLMLDEPSIGLAPIIVEQIFEAIQELKKHDLTAIIVEQNANLALSVADRAYVMEVGKVVMENSADHYLKDDAWRSVYFGDLH